MEELYTPALATMIITEFQNISTLNAHFDNLLANLTPKEIQLFTSIAAGSNIEQIAAKMDMNEDAIRRNIRLTSNKLVSNEQARTVIDTAQRNLPSMLSVTSLTSKPMTEYLTRQEFNEFKEVLTRRLNMLIAEPILQSKEGR